MESKMESALREAGDWWDTNASTLFEKTIDQNFSKLSQSFLATLEALSKDYLLMAQQQRKGEATYICVSFLRSSMLTYQNTHKIEILDSRYFEDWQECGRLWDNFFLFAPILDGILDIENQYKKYSSYKKYLFDDFWVEKSSALLMDFSKAMKTIVEKNLTKYQEIISVPSQVVYGEYRDDMQVLIKVG